MTWTHQNQMGDPARVAERREERPIVRSCSGCRYLMLEQNPFDGRRVLKCSEGMEVGQRCRLFEGKRDD